MKMTMLAFLVLTFSTAIFAETLTGTVKKFTGRYIETGKPYAYIAFGTAEDYRYEVPAIINAEELAKNPNNKVTIKADIIPMGCSDMSSACLAGKLENVKSVKIEL